MTGIETTSRLIGAVALAMAVAAPAGAQQSAPPARQTPDVVVEGVLIPPDEVPPRPVGTDLSGGDPRQSAVAKRILLEFSTRVAECAGRGKLSSLSMLRAAVDGMPYDATQRFAQGRLIETNITCGAGTTILRKPTTEMGESSFDRGALMIEALRRYAPDLRLTRAEVDDPAVRARYNRREVPRNRHRLPSDYDFFTIATCMVRYQPTLSVRLALDERSPASRLRIENAIVSGARPCVGGVEHVLFEPTELRLYIADAVYRWAVAARGVDSLLPETIASADTRQPG